MSLSGARTKGLRKRLFQRASTPNLGAVAVHVCGNKKVRPLLNCPPLWQSVAKMLATC